VRYQAALHSDIAALNAGEQALYGRGRRGASVASRDLFRRRQKRAGGLPVRSLEG
jgi:hypothetical protein